MGETTFWDNQEAAKRAEQIIGEAQAQVREMLGLANQQSQRTIAAAQSEAREHPVTKLVLETFGASIKEIKTDV